MRDSVGDGGHRHLRKIVERLNVGFDVETIAGGRRPQRRKHFGGLLLASRARALLAEGGVRHRWTGTAPRRGRYRRRTVYTGSCFFLSMVIRAIYHVEDCGRSRPGAEFKVADGKSETGKPRKTRKHDEIRRNSGCIRTYGPRL